jgi:hypothetical protein
MATGAEVQSVLDRTTQTYRKPDLNDQSAALDIGRSVLPQRANSHFHAHHNAEHAVARPLITAAASAERGARSRIMTRWFRVYDDLVDDPKVQRLDPSLFKALINLWCLASANDGVFPPIDKIAFKLRMKTEKAQRLLNELRAAGLVTDDERGVRPHNWDERQFISDVSTSRVKRFRERSRNVSPAVSETAPETETEQIQKQREDSDPNGSARDIRADLFGRGLKTLAAITGKTPDFRSFVHAHCCACSGLQLAQRRSTRIAATRTL